MTEELENKLIKYMTDFITEMICEICEEIDYDALNKYDGLDEVCDAEWDVNNPELAKWFKELRNVDIKKFDHYATYENDFYLRKTVNSYVALEFENMLTFSKNEPINYTYFNPKNFFKDEEELKEINEFISRYANSDERPESFTDTLFYSVLYNIKTIWYIDNLLKMEEDEIKELQF